MLVSSDNYWVVINSQNVQHEKDEPLGVGFVLNFCFSAMLRMSIRPPGGQTLAYYLALHLTPKTILKLSSKSPKVRM